MEGDTIFALSSGAARSGVAVIRISGPAAGEVLAAFIRRSLRPREAALCTIRDPDDGAVIDRGLVLHFPAPHSFTGEDIVELQVHGSLAIVRHLLMRLAERPGFRAAQPGEFTRRAWLAGRMDLLDVEALSDTLAAETALQRKLALDGSRWLRQQAGLWRAELLALRALIEAEIDFADEGDVRAGLDSATKRNILALAAAFRAATSRLRVGQGLRNGFRVAILGPPNAGKSSLMNALADRDVTITSPVPGTTRDVVEAVIDLDGVPIILMDTAGIRSATDDAIEAEGVARAQRAGAGADLVIWASPIDSPVEPSEDRYMVVQTKADLPLARRMDRLAVSSLTGEGVDFLTKEIHSRLGFAASIGLEGLIAHERHANCLREAAAALECAAAHGATTLDLRAENLRLACDALDSLTGRFNPEDVLGEIFSRFCIGK